MSIFLVCPHCQCSVEILEINCAIFRHGVLKQNGQQIPPHASKEDCDRWIEQDLLYGCGKPFQLIKNANQEWEAVICGYI